MATIINPAAHPQPERAGRPDGRRVALAQQGRDVINRRQKRTHRSEFSDEQRPNQKHWIEGNSSDSGNEDEQGANMETREILVTGGAGFIGTNLVEELQKRGAEF